jgi:hypothetical protein
MKRSIIIYLYRGIIDYVDITLYKKYISNLKSIIDNKKLPNQNIHHNYLIIKLFLMNLI